MYNYSIIIPHKNTPDLLVRMLDSIPYRDDTEIIIVDDNSDSEKVDFLRFPGLGKKNTKCIFTKEGYGAGYARNIGLQYAEGYWIFFADADDYFTPNFGDLLKQYAQRRDLDMVFVNAMIVDDYNNPHPLNLNRYIENFISGKRNSLDVLRFGFWSPWSRLIRRSIFIENNIKFEHARTGNDLMGIICASQKSTKFEVYKFIVYMYFKPSSGSQTCNSYDENSYLERLQQKLKLNKLYQGVNYPYKWPIMSAFRDKKINSSEKAKQLFKVYNYSTINDLYVLCRYIIAKLRGTI